MELMHRTRISKVVFFRNKLENHHFKTKVLLQNTGCEQATVTESLQSNDKRERDSALF